MYASRLDRRITIQRQVPAQNDLGEEVITWQDVATVSAQKIEARGDERFTAEQLVGKLSRSFRFRWSTTVKEVTVKHRIIFDGVEHEIIAMREIGRREGIEVDCTARSEIQVDNA